MKKKVSIWTKAFLISLIIPLLTLASWAFKVIQKINVNGFYNFDCGFDQPQPILCNALEYFFYGFEGALTMIAVIIVFILGLIVTNYAALVIVLKRKKSSYYLPALIIGLVVLIASIISYISLRAIY